MKVYIECYYADGTQILGNLDGQAVIRAKLYKRTDAYKRIKAILNGTKKVLAPVAMAKIVNEYGVVLETICT